MKFADKNFHVFSIAKKQRAEVCCVLWKMNTTEELHAFLLDLLSDRGQDVWNWIQQQAHVFCEKCVQRRITFVFYSSVNEMFGFGNSNRLKCFVNNVCNGRILRMIVSRASYWRIWKFEFVLILNSCEFWKGFIKVFEWMKLIMLQKVWIFVW